MSAQTSKPLAAIYLRISLDKTGDDLAIDRQREECADLLKRRGWEQYGEEYIDKVSAYRRDVKREAYEQLVADVKAGRVSRVIAWDLDRLTRQPRQLEEWIDLADERGVHVVTANGEADLGTDGGRMYARVKAAVAAQEIERKSARQKAAYAQQRAKGHPPLGPRPFGFRSNRRTPLESEAKHIREAYRILLSKENGEGSVYAVQRYFADQGIKTRTGRDWSQATVRQLIMRPSNAGLMRDNSGNLMAGKIKPIVDREVWDAAQAVLKTPGRTVPAGRKPVKFWLAGVASCGGCGAPMKAAGAKGHDYYRCKVATEPRADKTIKHVAIRAADLEAIVMAKILDEVKAGRFDGESGAAERVDEIQAELFSIRERQATAQQAVLDGKGDAANWLAGIAKLTREIEVLEEERDRLLARGEAVAPIAEKFRRLVTGLDDKGKASAVLKAWPVMYEHIDPEERRTLARGLGKITVEGGRAKPKERVKFAMASEQAMA